MAVVQYGVADAVKNGDTLFERGTRKPHGSIADRVRHAVGYRASSKLFAHPRPIVIKLVHVLLIELECAVIVSFDKSVSVPDYICGKGSGQCTKAYRMSTFHMQATTPLSPERSEFKLIARHRWGTNFCNGHCCDRVRGGSS